jgi:hypothetical protein
MESRTHLKKRIVIPKRKGKGLPKSTIMSQFYKAQIVGDEVKIIKTHPIEKAEAMRRVKQGEDVWGTKSNASTLAEALSDGQGSMRHAPHVIGGYSHYHDINHNYNGHIFYGQPRDGEIG